MTKTFNMLPAAKARGTLQHSWSRHCQTNVHVTNKNSNFYTNKSPIPTSPRRPSEEVCSTW